MDNLSDRDETRDKMSDGDAISDHPSGRNEIGDNTFVEDKVMGILSSEAAVAATAAK